MACLQVTPLSFSARAVFPDRIEIASQTSKPNLLKGDRYIAAEGRFKVKKLIACISGIFTGIHLQLTTVIKFGREITIRIMQASGYQI